MAPRRGLVLAENGRGERFGTVDILRWLRLSRLKFGASHVDVRIESAVPEDWHSILEEAKTFGLNLSIRGSGDLPPPPVRALKDLALSDVCVTSEGDDPDYLEDVLQTGAARARELAEETMDIVREVTGLGARSVAPIGAQEMP